MDFTTRGNTKSAASDTNGDLVIEGVPAAITAGLATADANATASMGTLANVHAARLARQTRTVATLTSTFGSDDPRVHDAVATATATRATVARIATVTAQVAMPSVQVAASGWALHGRIVTAQLQAAARFTVFLVDANKTFLRQYGFAYTDDTGYFLINYQGTAQVSAKDAVPRGDAAADTGASTETPDDAAAAERASRASANVGQTGTLQLFVEVANTEADPVYLAADAFSPTLGMASYVTLTLPADGKPIGDPPPEIRRVSLPPR